MAHSRWLHLAITVASAGVAVAQVPPGQGSGSAVGAEVAKPAGSSAVESSDIPVWKPSPARFAVAPFENESGAKSYEWAIAGIPFEIAEKTEDALGLEPTGGTLYVGAEKVPSEVEPVTAFARAREAEWVITGWVDRSNWKLRLGITLWQVKPGTEAVVVAEEQKAGEETAYPQILGDTLAAVWSKAGVAVDIARQQKLARPIGADYAVKLMGRGLGHLTGALGAVNLKLAEHD